MTRVVVPAELVGHHERFRQDVGRAWIARLPALAQSYLEHWSLTLDGDPRHGMVALVLPVLQADGTPAALKVQPLDEEHMGEEIALQTWAGAGAVRLLDFANPGDSTVMLLERLEDRSLSTMDNAYEAVGIIGGLLARLHAHAAPPGITTLADVAAAMVADAPDRARKLPPDEGRTLQRWADVVADLLAEPGDRLLHWDLHFDNVLAGTREPWLAIDPKPLAGDPSFDLLPGLHNRWEEAVATGDPARVTRRRFDQLVEILDLDRDRALGWTLARTLQNSIWDVNDGETRLNPVQTLIASALESR